MKRIVSFFVALVLLFSALGVTAFATMVDLEATDYIKRGTVAYDLSSYGVHTFKSYKVDVAPTIDGEISIGEYPGLSDRSIVGDGLYLTDKDGATVETDTGNKYRSCSLDTYLAFDNTYAYIAEEVTVPTSITTAVTTIVRYGLNQSELIPDAYSRLENSYTYKKGDPARLDKVDSGTRTYRELYAANQSSVRLDGDAYVDRDGNLWNLETYQSSANQAASARTDSGELVCVYEYRIPLADIAYSAYGWYDETSTASLVDSGAFYGSYQFSFSVSSALYISTSIPQAATIKAIYGNDASDSTWGKALKEYYTSDSGDTSDLNYVPSPVWHMSGNYAPIINKLKEPIHEYNQPLSSSYGFVEAPSVFRLTNVDEQYTTGSYGKYYTFTVVASGLDNTKPKEGETRVVPTQFRLRSGYATKLTGSFPDYVTGTFDASVLPSGLYTLVVTFTTQKWDGTQWVDAGVTRNMSRNITIAGAAKAAEASSTTGDDTLLFIACGVLAASVAFAGIAMAAKKRSFFIH